MITDDHSITGERGAVILFKYLAIIFGGGGGMGKLQKRLITKTPMRMFNLE